MLSNRPHVEDFHLPAINLNVGSESQHISSWFCIPFSPENNAKVKCLLIFLAEYLKFEQYAEEVLRGDDISDDFILSDYIWIPSLQELRKREIPFIQFDQHPGDLVFVNSGVYHWVWNKVL